LHLLWPWMKTRVWSPRSCPQRSHRGELSHFAQTSSGRRARGSSSPQYRHRPNIAACVSVLRRGLETLARRLKSGPSRADLDAVEEVACPTRRDRRARGRSGRYRLANPHRDGAARESDIACFTRFVRDACRTGRPCTALHDHRLLQEWPLDRTGPLSEAPPEWPSLLDVDGRDEHDRWQVADPGPLRQRRVVPDIVQGQLSP
jgi:hypothetical protein